MSLTDITIDSVIHKSYASVSEADAALAVDPTRSTKWASANADSKRIYLVAATNRLDVLRWKGEKAGGDSQLNEWPRSELKYASGGAVDDATVPKALERATILLAGSIALDQKHSTVGGTSSQVVSEVKAGSVQVKFRDSASTSTLTSVQGLSDEDVLALVQQWLVGSGATLPGAYSGADGASAFDDNFGRSGGFA